ncbi:hypothetical protein C8R47DRAFT_460223 [Mycena vitilis]|nr:hypothetical protein C8R47DRAFT_460223 [Mycena vitilis]
MDVDAQRQRVQELWFEDGNLVIQAGILCTASFVVSWPQGVPSSPTCTRSPKPIDSELVEAVLSYIFTTLRQKSQLFSRRFSNQNSSCLPSRNDFDTICGCLRLSHKYGVEYLRRRALVHLSSRHPSALSRLRCPYKQHGSIDVMEAAGDSILCILLIQVCREVDALWIIPYGFYVLAYYFGQLASEIFHGTVTRISPSAFQRQTSHLSCGVILSSETTQRMKF